MLTVLVVLSIWVLLNVLFVLVVVPPRKRRSQLSTPGTTLSPVPIDKKQAEQDEPFSLRHVMMSVAMGAFFVLVPPLMALRDAIVRFFRGAGQGDRP